MPIATAPPEVAGAYLELGGALLLLALAARLATRLDLSPVAFYLLGGLLLGATDWPDLTAEFVEVTANLGVVLLLFLLGLEYTAKELRANLRAHAPADVVDALLNFTPGFLAALMLGWGPQAAVVLGGVTWISSSGITAKALADLGRIGNRETPAVLSVLVTEDLAMVVYMPLVGSLLVGGGALAALGSFTVAAVAAIVTLLAALRYGARIERLLEHHSQEVVLLSALGLVLLVAGIAERLQVSAAVGAFLLGVALSRSRIEPATSLRPSATPLLALFGPPLMKYSNALLPLIRASSSRAHPADYVGGVLEAILKLDFQSRDRKTCRPPEYGGHRERIARFPRRPGSSRPAHPCAERGGPRRACQRSGGPCGFAHRRCRQ